MPASFMVECERERDGRWLAEIAELPGALVYAPSRREATAKARWLALRIVADRREARPRDGSIGSNC